MNVDKKLLYLLPSILALALSLTAFIFIFGNYLVDLQNTRYAIYVSVPEGWDDEKCLDCINDVLKEEGTNGFTILKNTEGGKVTDDKQIIVENSYQVLIMKISKAKAEQIAQELYERFEKNGVMIEKSIVDVTFVVDDTGEAK